MYAGASFRAWLGYSGRRTGFGGPDRFRERVDVGRADGAAMAVSRPAAERVGLLDERLFAYVEDVDWSLRVRAAGFDCVFVPSARAVHRVSASTGGASSTHTVYYGTRNTIVVCERHRPLGAAGTVARRACIAAAFLAHAGLVLRSRAAVAAVMQGYRDALAGRLGARSAA